VRRTALPVRRLATRPASRSTAARWLADANEIPTRCASWVVVQPLLRLAGMLAGVRPSSVASDSLARRTRTAGPGLHGGAGAAAT
jgi:hypothetical protein